MPPTVPPTVPSSAPTALARFNALTPAEAQRLLLECCSSPAWAEAVLAGRPFATLAQAQRAADEALRALPEADLDDALAGHPRIGERAGQGHNAERSAVEQAGLDDAAATTRAELAELNRTYEERFGHVYLVCASGLSADELLGRLRGRLTNDPATERGVVRDELAKINRLRLATMFAEDG